MPLSNGSEKPENQEGFDEFVYHGSENEEIEKQDDGEEYEFSEKNRYDLDEKECFIVVAIESNDPYESFGPFESREQAEEWISSNEDQFEGVHLTVVQCCPIEQEIKEEELEDESDESEELIIDESESSDEISHYEVVNTKNNEVVGRYENKNRARNMVDKLDNQYGAYVHKLVTVYAKKETQE